MNSQTSPLTLLQEALTHAGEDQQQLMRFSHLETRRITPDKELPHMEFLFRLFGKPCFPRGELVGITGKPKSGKTFICSILMTLCFREEVLTIHRDDDKPLSVIWFDTEQSDESTQDILCNRILPMIEGQSCASPSSSSEPDLFTADETESRPVFPPGFHVFNVRQDPWRDRLPLLEAAISRYSPDLVVLDGIRDLVNDINDGVLAQETVERLMHLASSQRCCIACILHQNKSADDKNLRGWIGTELTHKAFEVYECAKNEDHIFSFSQQLTRKYDILDTLKYIVDEKGIPQLASIEQILESEQRQSAYDARPEMNRSYITEWNGRTPIFDLRRLFIDAMPQEGLQYIAKDLQEKVMSLANITSPFFYNKLREKALQEGLIVRTENQFGYVVYYRPSALPPGDAPF